MRKDFPANNLKEFVAYAKANESKLNMAHAGVGSVSYIGCLLLNSAIGIKPTLVPFTGTAPVMNAILAGQVDYDCDPVLGPAAACARRHRARRSPSPPRSGSPLLPDVPTSAEQGMPEFDCAPFYAVFAPKGTPKEIVDKLAEALNKGLDEQAVRKRLDDLGADIAEPSAAARRRWRAGAERDRAADADPEGGGGEVAACIRRADRAARNRPGIHARKTVKRAAGMTRRGFAETVKPAIPIASANAARTSGGWP